MGYDPLDKLLEEGVFKGYARMDLALIAAGMFLVFMWGFFTYFPSASIPFIHTDHRSIVSNEALHRATTISEGWNGDSLRPLAALSLAFDWTLGGGSPAVFHGTNVVLHLLNVALLFLLCRRVFAREVSETVCLSAALLLVVHPASVAAAIDLSNRGILLGATFTLLTVLCYVGRRDETRDWDLTSAISLIAMTLAWASHVAAWALPALLIAVDLATTRSLAKVRWRRLAPFAFLAAAFLTVNVTTRIALDQEVPGFAGLFDRAGAFPTFVASVAMFAEPVAAYPPADSSWIGVVLVTIALAGGFASLRFAPTFGFAIAWAAILFVSPGLIDSRHATTNPAESYIAVIGVLVILPAIIVRVPRGWMRTGFGLGFTAVLFILSAFAFAAAVGWQDEERVLLASRDACAECDGLKERLAALYVGRARDLQTIAGQTQASGEPIDMGESSLNAFRSAIPLLEQLVETDPRNVNAWVDLGDARAALGEEALAREAYETARLADPWSATACTRLAAAISGGEHGDLVRAVELYRAAAAIEQLPDRDAAAYAGLLTRLGDFEGADAVLRAAIETSESKMLRDMQARNAESIAALKAREDRLKGLEGRAKVYEQANLHYLRRNFLQSTYVIDEELRANGFYEPLWLLLAQNRNAMGQLENFVSEYRLDGTITPQNWTNLAEVFTKSGETEAAAAVLSQIAGAGQN